MFIKYPPLRPSNPPSPTRGKATKGTENKVAANIINKPVPISSTAGPGKVSRASNSIVSRVVGCRDELKMLVQAARGG